MTQFLLALTAIVVVATLLASAAKVSHVQLYRSRIGLDLAGLVKLLPAELQRTDFNRYLFHIREDRIFVGLTFPTKEAYRGNPPNVGLEFDLSTGHLIAVHPEGVALGLK